MWPTLSRAASSLVLLLSLLQIPASVNGYIDWDAIPDTFVGPGVGQNQQTDFCDVVRNSSAELLDALKGKNVSIAVEYGEGFDFFIYDPVEPLSISNPMGMIPTLLDELARRGGFSWRNSFVAYDTNTINKLVGGGAGRYDRMLNWTISNFDLSVNKWILTTERLENETVYLHSWFDGGLILVDSGDQAELNWLGFAAPFDGYVWWAIAGTVIFSSVFMMVIETMEGRRDGRSYKWWLGDQLYFSNLAISQHFQFPNPKTGAGRLFLSSFAFWSMLVGATYTANLASLLVESALASPIASIESAMDNDLRICIHEGSASQNIMYSLIPKTRTYDNFVFVQNPEIMYDHLRDGVCDILLGTQQEYQIFGSQQRFGCNLVQAGKEVHSSSASFAIEFDPLNCDSVLAHVLNIHLNSIDVDGNMTKYWNTYLDNIDDTCTSEEDEKMGLRRRMVETNGFDGFDVNANANTQPRSNRRRLFTKTSTDSATSGSGSEESLSITSMAGIFMIHAVSTVISTIMALVSVRQKRKKRRAAALRKGKKFDNNSFMESELNLKYLTMKRDMALQMNNMKLDMMLQMDNFFERQLRSMSNTTMGNVDVEQTAPLQPSFNNTEDSRKKSEAIKISEPPTISDAGQIMGETVHMTGGSVDTGDMHYDDLYEDESSLFDL